MLQGGRDSGASKFERDWLGPKGTLSGYCMLVIQLVTTKQSFHH